MGLVRGMWLAVSDDPVVMRRLNGWLTVFWVAREHRLRSEEDIPGEVVERIVRDTQLDLPAEREAAGARTHDPS